MKKKSYTNARREMFQKWSLELTQQIDENIKDFPFGTKRYGSSKWRHNNESWKKRWCIK